MSDQHNKNVLGCYGDHIVRTPHIDRLAAEGIKFDHAYCSAPLCVPSRMSFMTSRRPSANQVWHNGHVLNSGIPTWADYLNWSGYDTTLIGRMDFTGPDQRHGFQRHMPGELNARWDKIPRVACGQRGESVRITGTGTSAYAWYDALIANQACAFIEKRARCPGNKPFAAVVGFLQPHAPYVAPKPLFEYYHNKVSVPVIDEGQLPEQVRRHRSMHGFNTEITERQARNARAAYYGLCENTDRLTGTILDQLDRCSLAGETVVIYCSDHGDMLGQHGCWFKSTYYEGSAGVPLIMRWPGHIPQNRVSSALVSLMDLGPTFCELAHGTTMEDVDGHSLMPLIKGIPDAPWRNTVFAELAHVQVTPEIPSRMIRSGDWKLWTALYPGDEQYVMFNLRNDPGEKHDLAGKPGLEKVRDRLMRELKADWAPDMVRALSERQRKDVARLLHANDRQAWEYGGLAVTAPAQVDADVVLM